MNCVSQKNFILEYVNSKSGIYVVLKETLKFPMNDCRKCKLKYLKLKQMKAVKKLCENDCICW